MKGHETVTLQLALRDNLEFMEEMFLRFENDPSSVPADWQMYFRSPGFLASDEAAPPTGEIPDSLSRRASAWLAAVREQGHLGADLNPLSPSSGKWPSEISPERFGLGAEMRGSGVSLPEFQEGRRLTVAELDETLQKIYLGHLGVEWGDSLATPEGAWLLNRVETLSLPLETEVRKRILAQLVASDSLEKFLHTRFQGKKRFSLEGLDALIPMLHAAARRGVAFGVTECVMGMAHRGRLNVLINFLGKPAEHLFAEFDESESSPFDIEGDVKYHMGFSAPYSGYEGLQLTLMPNPSHLEAVCPVVEGYALCRQVQLGGKEKVLPLLIHGDASVAGQGVVSETLNLAGLEAYSTGGTVHVVTNNQIGFTTFPRDSRSGRYATEVARQLRAPVFHVNADHPEMCVLAMELALDFRMKFGRDVVVDLVGYRRFGHNEGDEPSFTQPEMYRKILGHPTVVQLYTRELVNAGVLVQVEADARAAECRTTLDGALSRLRAGGLSLPAKKALPLRDEVMGKVATAVPQIELCRVGRLLATVPEGFVAHPKLARILEGRLRMLDGDGAVDWGLGELLALGTVLTEGHPVRLSGQDCKRGTFSSRHAVLFESSGREWSALSALGAARADVINSPLSEMACLGFEFGYSVAHPEALVLWEAQFGDFANGAQIIIDQFLAASESKWGQTSGLVLLLPHGYEGMGPEHSNARPERFLQLCGNLNLQVCNVTTPAQLFHLMRRQVKRGFRKPLVVMSPKSLLRHPEVVSPLRDFTQGGFSEILAEMGDPARVDRLLCCSGKISLDLRAEWRKRDAPNVGIVRFEQLYPFPAEAFRALLERCPRVQEAVWVQEEPKNMGAWNFWRGRMEDSFTSEFVLQYVGRKASGTTAEGNSKSHADEQSRIVQEAFSLATGWQPLRDFAL